MKLGENSYADVAIKVLSVPYRIYSASGEGNDKKDLLFTGDLGMCFSGSVVTSLFLKQAIEEVLKNLQATPSFTQVSLSELACIVFKSYASISEKVCATDLDRRGIAEIFIAGKCPTENLFKAFKFTTDQQNNKHSYSEVLKEEGEYIFSGTGSSKAEELIDGQLINSASLLQVLKKTIDDQQVPSVGGNIQYGTFKVCNFITYGIVECIEDDGVNVIKYWRGPLDLNSSEFSKICDDLILSYSLIDPFNTFKR